MALSEQLTPTSVMTAVLSAEAVGVASAGVEQEHGGISACGEVWKELSGLQSCS